MVGIFEKVLEGGRRNEGRAAAQVDLPDPAGPAKMAECSPKAKILINLA
jgi:hypothetical protein